MKAKNETPKQVLSKKQVRAYVNSLNRSISVTKSNLSIHEVKYSSWSRTATLEEKTECGLFILENLDNKYSTPTEKPITPNHTRNPFTWLEQRTETHPTATALKMVFNPFTLPINRNRLSLYPKNYNPETYQLITVEFGDCKTQRNHYPFTSYKFGKGNPKQVLRKLVRKEKQVLTLRTLNFNPKFVYSLRFQCPFCANNSPKQIKKNHHLANNRVTPKCKKHNQVMYLKTVSKKLQKQPTRKLSIPKSIYKN